MDVSRDIRPSQPVSVPLRLPTLGRDGMLLLLTWAAGGVDAISYLGLGHVFTAMMTGNTVLLGLALGQGQVLAALRSILALIGFAAGVAAGAMIVQRPPRLAGWPPAVTVALAIEGALLGIFAVLWHLTGPERGDAGVNLLILLTALAMGIQSAAVQRLGVPGIMTTYITGTLTSLMVDLAIWLRPVEDARPPAFSPLRPGAPGGPLVPWERRVGLLAAVFLFYGLGALAGGFLQNRAFSFVSALPFIAVSLVVANASVRQRRGD